MGDFATAAAGAALRMARSSQRAEAANAAARAGADRRIEQSRKTREIRERRLRDRARQLLARQRARFGARGIRGGGSADAVLRGVSGDTERAIADDRSLDALRIGGINAALAERRRRNLLDASEARRRQVFGLLSRGLNGFSLLD